MEISIKLLPIDINFILKSHRNLNTKCNVASF